MDVVVTGSHGLIGTALAGVLTASGDRALRLVRGRATDADAIAWDPEAGTIDAARLEGVDAVVHLAGAGIGDERWTAARKRVVLESRTKGTTLLARTLAGLSEKPAVLVSASAVGYYGDRGDEVLTEESSPGGGFLAEVCHAWEDATAPVADAGIRVARVRSGVVLARDGGMLPRLLLPFKLGLGGRIGSGRQYMSWISIEDEVGAIQHVLADDSLGGPVNLTAPTPVTNADFVSTLGRVLRRPTVLPTPLLPLKARYGSELVQELLLFGQRAVPTRLAASGYQFAHDDLEGALRALLVRPA